MSRSSDRVAVFRRLKSVDGFDGRITTLEESGVGGAGEHIASAPPATGDTVVNAYYDPAQGKLIVEYDDAVDPSGTITSTPPVGSFEVTNIYMSGGSLFFQYEDAP